MNVAGLGFNNKNWPYIIRMGRIWMLTVLVLFPVIYLFMTKIFFEVWSDIKVVFELVACLGFFIPMIITGKIHEK